MSKFLFVYPHKDNGLFLGCTYHIGPAYIISHGKYHKNDVDFYLCDNSKSISQIANEICLKAEIAIGFTVYDSNFLIIDRIAREIKKIDNKIIICGGPSSTASAKEIMTFCSSIDACVLGEGEDIFKNLFDSNFNLSDKEDSPNLLTREKLFQYKSNSIQIFPKTDINIISSPYLTKIIPIDYVKTIGLYSARGCNFKCTYCSFSALSGYKIRFYPEKLFLDEVKMVIDYFTNTKETVLIPINDDTFTANIKRAKRLLKYMGEMNKSKNINFWLDVRADQVTDSEFFALAKNAGVSEMNFGLESTSATVLSLVKKVSTKPSESLEKEIAFVKKVKWAVSEAKKFGIKPTVSIITGLPGDNLKNAIQTVKFVKSLDIHSYSHNYLHVFNGTELNITSSQYNINKQSNERSPFLTTKHSFDIGKVPILHHDSHIFDYRRGPLLFTILTLTGMVTFLNNIGVKKVYFSKNGDYNPEFVSDGPAGSLIVKLKDEIQKNDSNLLTYELYKEGNKYIVEKNQFKNKKFLPLLHFNLDAEKIENKVKINFYTSSSYKNLKNKLDNNNLMVWDIPYAACGLVRGDCPVRVNKLSNGLTSCNCPFFDIKVENKYEYTECATCTHQSSCPKCSYMHKLYGDNYCEHQKSKYSIYIMSLIKAIIHILENRNININKLPTIKIVKNKILDIDYFFVEIDNELFLTKDNSFFKAPSEITAAYFLNN